jgi:membrane-associated phospholipid phosphatase
LVAEVFAPAQVVAVLLVAISIHTAPPGDALRWALISIVFASLLPMAYVVAQVRRRRLTDHHVSIRRQRRLPMLVAIASTVIGVALLFALGAPRPLVALAAAGVAGLVVTFLVTLAWKISMHVAVLAGAVTIVVIVFGPQWLPLAAVVALVAWARVAGGDHTPAQVAAGALIGCLVAATVFLLLR